ncbi:MAG: G8 domain-containing protein [Fuerstiella sp.]
MLSAVVVADGGFEDPVQPDNAFEQASGTGSGTLVGSQWTITSGAGITRNLSPFQNQKIPAPEGVQHGLIQSGGSFSQTVSGFVIGAEYELSLLTMARQTGNGNDLAVILDRGLATEMSLIDIPEVTTFGAFTEVVSPTFVATKSSYTLTIHADLNEGTLSGGRTTFFDNVAFHSIQPPFVARTVSDGTRIQAEDFDNGVNGIAYVDTTAGNAGGQYRTGEDVDIEATADAGGGHNVTSIADGESLEYTADVTAGLFDIDVRVAAASAAASIRFLVSDNPDTEFAELGTVEIPDSGGNWTTVTLNNADFLHDGGADRVFRLEMIGGGFDLNWFEFSAVSPKTTRAVQSGDWDDPATWDNGLPNALARVIVNQGSTVTLDGTDHFADEVVVHGVLDVAEDATSRSLTTRWIHVNSSGVFQIGTEADRYDEGDFVLTLTGTDPTADHVIETATGTMSVSDNDGFLMAVGGGRLQFFGEEKLSFTKLGTTADVGATQITVENVIERNFTDGALDVQNDPVTSAADDGSLNWEVGDQIVIASSAYRDYEQEEVRTIVAVNDLGTQTEITLDRALNYRHYGEIETYGQTQATGTNDPGRTWDIDMRAEVALLSRNVRIQGTPEQDTDTQFGDRLRYDTTNPDGSLVKGIGGHTMIMPTAGQTTVDGVQFDRMGQTGQLGRYPMHWHEAGDRAGDVLRNSSITNSNNRGLTIHGTHNLRIEGVVQHDIHGHGFFMEDGVETGTEFIANITYGVHKVGGAVGNTDPFNVDTHDEVQQTFNRFISSAAFWITNPDNTWVGNIAAGSEGSGFWFILPTQAIGASAGNPIYDGVDALRTNIREFAHNTAHSAEIGLTFDRGTDIGGTSNRYDPIGGPPVVSHFTAYQNRTAIYHRGLEQVFDELRLADNENGTFNTYDQEIYNSLYVGHSRGNSDVTQRRRAHLLYDGPSVISDSHFAGFGEETALTFDGVGGAEKFTEHFVSGLSFENDGTYDNISNTVSLPLALNQYGVIYDSDGSLTSAVGGGPGRVVVPGEPFMVDNDGSDFQPAGWQAWVTDNRYAEFYVRKFDTGAGIPQTLITTPKGETVDLVAETDTASEPGGSISVKMPLIVEGGDYTVEFPAGFDPASEHFYMRFEIRRSVNVPEHASTVLIFPGIGSTITADGAARVYSETALRSATETSYFHSPDGNLLVHLHVDPNASFRTANIYTQLVTRAQRTLTTAIASGNWFDASIWDNGIPDETTRTIISQGVTVTMDGPEHLAKEIVVHGTLDVAEGDQLNVLDNGFEFPVQPDNAFEQASGTGAGTLVGSQWTISGGAGITRNLSAFQSGGIPAPEGEQHGLIQGGGFFRQTVNGFVPGAQYDLSLLTMARQGGRFGNDLEVVLDQGLPTEVGLIDIPEVTFSSFTEVTSSTFLATKASYTLTISSDLNEGALAGDRTTFFDDARFEVLVPVNPDPGEDPVPTTLTANWIHVNSGGVFQVGTVADRFDDGEFIVTLTGIDQEADHVIETTTGTMNVNNNDGFLMTAMNGRLQFFGDDKVTFSKLAATVEAGADTITVANIIERNFDGTTSAASDGELNWEVGDEIVVASSSYDYNDEEVRTITAVNNTGTETILTLDTALAHRHYGEIETYGNGTRTWDIDLRGEVALLNRSITIQGTQDTDNSFGDRGQYGTDAGQNVGIGAHTMVMPGSGQITIDAVRFDKMGQTGTLGRYPMHWHVAGDRSGDVMRNSSVTNSNNRGVTVHGTQGVLLEGNVLHDIHGHGFFMEDAAETDNQFLHNIALGIHKVGGGFTSTDPFVVPGITRGGDGKVNGEAPRSENGESSHDTGQNAPNRFVHSAAFWITNPDNTWVGNIAAGSEGTGFWFALPETVLGLSKDTGLYNGLNPMRTNLLQFDNNTGHSSQVGLTFDRGEDISGQASSNTFQPPQTMQINNFTAYKNHGTAVYHRALVGVFNESRFADNAFGSFNTFNQEEHNILFVGHSRGNAEPATLVGGYRLYDGPGRIVDSHFAGFAADNAHAFRIEGGANKFSHTRAEGISFENDGTADTLGIELYGNNFFSVDNSPEFVAGRPDALSGLVYDVDGSLTGHAGGGPGYVLTPKVDFYRDSTDITPAGWDGYISDDRYAQLRLGRIADVQGDYIPPFRISNGDGHSIVADRWNLSYVQRMYTKVNAGDYTVEFLSGIPADGFDINLDIKTVSQAGDATVFRFVDVGKSYKPDQGTEVTSLGALRSAGSSSWFRAADGDLWMKIIESGTTIDVQPTTPLVVSNSNDSGTGSLRAAIDAANSNAGFDTITFDIGADGSTHTIQPQTPLPTITDRVYIDGSTQAPLPILDGGFESPVQPDNDWELANGSGNGTLAGSQWTIAGGAGIARNLSAWQAGAPGQVPAPEGEQLAVIQGNGSFSQTVSGFEVGQTYELSLLAMGRRTNNLGGDLKATLDVGLGSETTLINIPEVMFPRFTEVNGTSFVATKITYTLTIQSDQNIGDTLFDDVTFGLVSPPVVIDGSVAGGSAGLEFTAPGGVASLTVNGFANGAGIQLSGTGGSFVDGVWSGVDATGTTAFPNRFGIRVESDGNTIRNSLLSGNTLAGIRVLNADGNVITGNVIGTGPSGTTALANGGDGVELRSSTDATVTGNVIAFNGEDGVLVVDVSTGNTISNNSIFSNGQLGIDLGNDGVTPNDNLDADTGPNNLINFPVLTGAAAVPIPAHILFQDNFDDAVSTTLDDPSARATGLLADLVKYDFTNVDAGEVAVTSGLLDWTGTNIANGNLETSNGNQNWTFRTAVGGNTHFDWAPYLAGDIYDISFTYRSAWSHPLTFGISDTPQPGNWAADTNAGYDYAFGAWGSQWDSGEDGNTTRTAGGAGNTEFDVVLKIDETVGTAEAWVDGSLISTTSIDFESSGRYFSFGEPNSYGGYIDDFTVFVMPIRWMTTIVGEMTGLADTEYTLEFFSNDQLDATGHDEGQTVVHSMTVTTNATGIAPFNSDVSLAEALGTFMTATATDPSGNTSEFSAGVEVGPPELIVSIAAASIAEDAGTAATTATISRNTDTTNALTVTLASSDTGEATVPATITIAAGQTTSAPFNIDAVDDAIVDGTQTVTVTGSATAHADGTDTVDVTDDDVAELTVVILAPDFSENGGSTTATVSRNTDTTDALTVTLASSDTGEATVPATITIAAGQTTSAPFTISGVDDAVVDGTQAVTVTGIATAHADGTDTVDVTDYDVAELTVVILAPDFSENGGSTTATVSRNTDTTNALTVNLASDDTSEATVPATVTIPAGQTTSAAFNITAVDDAIVDGTQTVTITASAAAHPDSTGTLDVTDDDTAGLTVTIVAASISENGGTTTATITRNTDVTAALTVNLASDDEGEVTVPATLMIAAGQATSAAFTISGVDDAIVDGTQTATITVSAAAHADGTDTVEVTDDDIAVTGDMDGDSDFDANDSFLIHLVKLSGTDQQIEQSKGSSPLSAALIRANITDLGTAADIDGDNDFDANDSFLIHLVKLSGTDAQIDQSKGSSSLSAAQIRANINALDGGTATSSSAANSLQVVRSVLASDAARDLFSDIGTDVEDVPTLLREVDPSDFPDDSVWEEFRYWIDAI